MLNQLPEPPPRKNLAAALIKARKAARATVYKAGHNQDQRYSYVGHEQVVIASRDALLDNGLSLEQRSVEYIGELVYQTKNGPKPVWRWVGQFALVHESGEERGYRYEATTQANDKAAFVASTALDRVAHMRVLELAGTADEDPEHDWHDERARQEDPRPAPQQPPAQAPQDAPRPSDRTADPPTSNVRRLPAPEETPEGKMARELFLPKLVRLRGANELRGWWVEVCKGDYPRNVKVALYRTFESHAKRLGHNPAQLVGVE
jgi:hypothetical protein